MQVSSSDSVAAFAPAMFKDARNTVATTQLTMGFQNDTQNGALLGYTMIPDKFYTKKPCRNALGLVGGNEVSITNSMVDLESDLRGITRPNTRCNSRQYNPECHLGGGACPSWPSGIRYNTKDTDERRTIPTQPNHLPTCQMNSYQPVPYPKGFQQSTGATYRF